MTAQFQASVTLFEEDFVCPLMCPSLIYCSLNLDERKKKKAKKNRPAHNAKQRRERAIRQGAYFRNYPKVRVNLSVLMDGQECPRAGCANCETLLSDKKEATGEQHGVIWRPS